MGEPVQSELSTIDFSGADFSPRGLAEYAESVEVKEVSAGSGAVYEEAAVLYANGSVKEAEILLEAALRDDKAASAKGLWMMLLDLYELTGQRERFESKVLDYATRFERSPPPWVDLSNSQPRPQSSIMPSMSLAGSLDAKIETQLAQIRAVAHKSGSIRIDLNRARGCDETASQLLLDTIKQLAADRIKITFLNCNALIRSLEGQVKPGEQTVPALWKLLLELLQHAGEYEHFEEVALDYAITFEESPPSWEKKAPTPKEVAEAKEAASTAEAADAANGHACVLEGELTNADSGSIRNLAAYAVDRKTVDVDCSNLRRLDFVSAGTLFNVLATLRAQSTTVTLLNVNAMVGALLRVMSVDQVAKVMLRD